MNPLQRLLEGMPTPRPPLSVHNKDGGCVVLAGPVVVFGPYEPGDLGMRNMGVVYLYLTSRLTFQSQIDLTFLCLRQRRGQHVQDERYMLAR